VVFGERALNQKGYKTGLFMLLKQDVGLAKVRRVSCLFVQKREVNLYDQNY